MTRRDKLLSVSLALLNLLLAGLQMAEFPLPPMLSRMLLASGEMGCSEEITAIVAMLQVGVARRTVSDFNDGCCDRCNTCSFNLLASVQKQLSDGKTRLQCACHLLQHTHLCLNRLLFTAEEGDHLTLLNVYMGFEKAKYNVGWCHKNYLNSKSMLRARDVCRQLRKTLR
jgi:ATP-dependent RNA helicase DDX35